MSESPDPTRPSTPLPVAVTASVPITLATTLPATTAEESELALKTEGQRAINLIWETTQMRIALSVIWAALIVGTTLSVLGKYLGTPDIQLAAVVFLFGVANLVTGFYFGRTNHQRTGGTGTHTQNEGR